MSTPTARATELASGHLFTCQVWVVLLATILLILTAAIWVPWKGYLKKAGTGVSPEWHWSATLVPKARPFGPGFGHWSGTPVPLQCHSGDTPVPAFFRYPFQGTQIAAMRIKSNGTFRGVTNGVRRLSGGAFSLFTGGAFGYSRPLTVRSGSNLPPGARALKCRVLF